MWEPETVKQVGPGVTQQAEDGIWERCLGMGATELKWDAMSTAPILQGDRAAGGWAANKR